MSREAEQKGTFEGIKALALAQKNSPENSFDMDRQRRVGLPWARVSLDQRAGFGEECPAAQVGVTTPVRRIPLGRPRPLHTFPHPLKEKPIAR